MFPSIEPYSIRRRIDSNRTIILSVRFVEDEDFFNNTDIRESLQLFTSVFTVHYQSIGPSAA